MSVSNNKVKESDAMVVSPKEDEYVPDCMCEGQLPVQPEENNPTQKEESSESNIVQLVS